MSNTSAAYEVSQPEILTHKERDVQVVRVPSSSVQDSLSTITRSFFEDEQHLLTIVHARLMKGITESRIDFSAVNKAAMLGIVPDTIKIEDFQGDPRRLNGRTISYLMAFLRVTPSALFAGEIGSLSDKSRETILRQMAMISYNELGVVQKDEVHRLSKLTKSQFDAELAWALLVSLESFLHRQTSGAGDLTLAAAVPEAAMI